MFYTKKSKGKCKVKFMWNCFYPGEGKISSLPIRLQKLDLKVEDEPFTIFTNRLVGGSLCGLMFILRHDYCGLD